MKNVPAEEVGVFFFCILLFGTPISGPPIGVLFSSQSGILTKKIIYYI